MSPEYFVIFYVLNSDWWSGLLEHSILSTVWWASVLQGSLGSGLALLGVFLVVRHELRRDERARQFERDRDQQTRADERSSEIEKRTFESVSALNSACTRLMYDAHESKRPGVELAEQMFDLLIREGRDYPSLKKWIIDFQDHLIGSIEPGRQAELIPGVAANISGVMTAWVLEGCHDDFFARDDVNKRWELICIKEGIKPKPSASNSTGSAPAV